MKNLNFSSSDSWQEGALSVDDKKDDDAGQSPATTQIQPPHANGAAADDASGAMLHSASHDKKFIQDASKPATTRTQTTTVAVVTPLQVDRPSVSNRAFHRDPTATEEQNSLKLPLLGLSDCPNDDDEQSNDLAAAPVDKNDHNDTLNDDDDISILGGTDKEWECVMDAIISEDPDMIFDEVDSDDSLEPIPLEDAGEFDTTTSVLVVSSICDPSNKSDALIVPSRQSPTASSLQDPATSNAFIENETPNVSREVGTVDKKADRGRTRRNHRKRSHGMCQPDDSSGGSNNGGNGSNKKIKPRIVGPNSTKMLPIEHMMIYLEETTRVEDSEYLARIRSIVADCEVHHARGEYKYMNLPGAVFERVVGEVGGDAFGRIYKASQEFDHPRVRALLSSRGAPASGGKGVTDAAAAAATDDEAAMADLSKKLVASCPPGRPNLLQVAVAYGFHLARINLMEALRTPPPPRTQHATTTAGNNNNNNNTVKDVLMTGAEYVLRMKEDERALFWKYMTESQLLSKQMQPLQQNNKE